MSTPTPIRTGRSPSSHHDLSGYPIYDEGEIGAIHVFAHRMLDLGQFRLGHHVLGRWLATRSGRGTHWVHVQWHMAVFELKVHRWHDALARFNHQIRPYTFASQDALTDAPSLLWRLHLSAPGPVDLPWTETHRTARRSLGRTCPPYVQLHNLLALAGANDITMLDRWLTDAATADGSPTGALLWRMGQGLRAYAAGDYRQATSHMASAVPGIPEIGGSRAQNELFELLHRSAIALAGPVAPRIFARHAA